MAITKITHAEVMAAVHGFTSARETFDMHMGAINSEVSESAAFLHGAAGMALRQQMEQANVASQKANQILQEITDNVTKQSTHMQTADEDNHHAILSSFAGLTEQV